LKEKKREKRENSFNLEKELEWMEFLIETNLSFAIFNNFMLKEKKRERQERNPEKIERVIFEFLSIYLNSLFSIFKHQLKFDF
jgi:hypothetical protein